MDETMPWIGLEGHPRSTHVGASIRWAASCAESALAAAPYLQSFVHVSIASILGSAPRSQSTGHRAGPGTSIPTTEESR
jgi:hypothetical protein